MRPQCSTTRGNKLCRERADPGFSVSPPEHRSQPVVAQNRFHHRDLHLRVSANDILSAIQRGFRAIIDTKGKLAEYFLYRDLEDLQKKKIITDLVWFDADGKPDFTFAFRGKSLRLECKNVR